MAKKKPDQRRKRGRAIGLLAAFAFLGWLAFTVANEPGGSGPDQSGASQAAAASPAPLRPFGGDGYVLDFGSDFKAGLNSVDDLGLSVVIAMDQSGSMADPPAKGGREAKYLQAARALEQIVGFLHGNFGGQAAGGLILKVGIIGFSDTVQELFPLTVMDQAGFGKLGEALADPSFFDPGGKTAMGAAMEAGARVLAQSGTVLRSLIVVTDGENNKEPDPVAVLAALNQNRNNASTVEFPVYTQGTLVSFVGFDTAAGGFRRLHEQGARVTSAADQTELQAALRQILIADITRLEAAGN